MTASWECPACLEAVWIEDGPIAATLDAIRAAMREHAAACAALLAYRSGGAA